MPMLWFHCLRLTLVRVAVFVSALQRCAGYAEGAPLLATSALVIFGVLAPCTRVAFFVCIPALRLLDGCKRSIALAAQPHWWQCSGAAFAACFTAWLPLERLVFSARPHDRLPTCSTSYLHSAKFSNYCFGDLTFTAEEQDAIVVAPDSVAILAEDFASSLVGKVKDDKVLTISEINPNFFLISFSSPENRANVLKRGPWDFQKYWFALEQADPNRTIHDYSFLHMCIWVRIHNIPLSLMTAVLARDLGALIGKVIMTDTRLEDGNMGEFMRVRVLIDTSKPLHRYVVLSRPDAKASMCPLQYERLPLFCHGCGLIGHPVLACSTTPKVEGQKS
ncbi:hypothetical protein GQ457_10G009440 [Hibiscus cannabinus]